MQYDSSKCHLYFSYLPEGEKLLTVPQEEEDPMQEEEEDEVMKDADEEAPPAKKARLNRA